MPTLLSRFSPLDVRTDPFPHIVAENALPDDLVSELVRTFPPDDVIRDGAPAGDNKRFDYAIGQVRAHPERIPAVWRDFLEAQASPAFWADFCRLFGAHAAARYPALAGRYGSLERMRPGIRYVDRPERADIFLDAHLSINTPVLSRASPVRTAHVDDTPKLYGGLWYLRDPDDDTEGGDLVLYRYRPGRHTFYGPHIRSKFIEEVGRVPYARNSLIFFLNSPESLHAVTPRATTAHTRKFVNLVGETSFPLFDLGPLQENIWLKRLRTYGGPLFKGEYENR